MIDHLATQNSSFTNKTISTIKALGCPLMYIMVSTLGASLPISFFPEPYFILNVARLSKLINHRSRIVNGVPVLASLRADVKLASVEQNIAWGLKGVP